MKIHILIRIFALCIITILIAACSILEEYVNTGEDDTSGIVVPPGFDPADADLDEFLIEGNLDEGAFTMTINRNGLQPIPGLAPITWNVYGEIEIPITFNPDLKEDGDNMWVIDGNDIGLASWSYGEGMCEGSGTWPLSFQVTGVLFQQATGECSIVINIKENWLPGSFFRCDLWRSDKQYTERTC